MSKILHNAFFNYLWAHKKSDEININDIHFYNVIWGIGLNRVYMKENDVDEDQSFLTGTNVND